MAIAYKGKQKSRLPKSKTEVPKFDFPDWLKAAASVWWNYNRSNMFGIPGDFGYPPAAGSGWSGMPTQQAAQAATQQQQTKTAVPFQGYGSTLPPWGYGPPPPTTQAGVTGQSTVNYTGGTAYDDQGYSNSNRDQYLKSRGLPPERSSYWQYGATPKWSSGVPRLPGTRGTGQRAAYRSPVQPGIGRTDQSGGSFAVRQYGYPGGTQYLIGEGEMKDEVLRQLYSAGEIPNPFEPTTPSVPATNESPGNAKYTGPEYYNSLIAWRNAETAAPRQAVVPVRRESSRTRRK